MSRDLAARISVPLGRRWIEGEAVQLHVRTAGPVDGPLVVLLHGFPEFWYGWYRQIAPLAEAGYRVVVPDQRGYNRSDAPPEVAAYDLNLLTADIRRLIDAFGRVRAHVVGHDWGGMVAWMLAMTVPERIHRLAILNAPHPRVFVRILRTHPTQLVRSLYALFFQIPKLPEWLLGRKGGDSLTRMLRWSGRPDTFSERDLAAYRTAWLRPGRLRGMLNWYRAGARRAIRGDVPDGSVDVPTLILWGARDIALSRHMAAPSAAMCTNGQCAIFDEATHWVQHDAPETVTRHLLDHLNRG